MQSELKPCPFCGGEASIGHVAFSRPLTHIEWEDGTPVTEAFYGHCKNCNASTRNGLHGGQRNEAEAIAAWNTRASDAEITRLTEALRAAEEQVKGLREALESKPWPPTDADLREMLALIVGAWWSESSANRLRAARMLNAEDIKGMYAVRDALAPYIARAAMKGPSHD